MSFNVSKVTFTNAQLGLLTSILTCDVSTTKEENIDAAHVEATNKVAVRANQKSCIKADQ